MTPHSSLQSNHMLARQRRTLQHAKSYAICSHVHIFSIKSLPLETLMAAWPLESFDRVTAWRSDALVVNNAGEFCCKVMGVGNALLVSTQCSLSRYAFKTSTSNRQLPTSSQPS